MISRENIARLIESPPITGLFDDVSDSLKGVESTLLSALSSLLSGVPLEEDRAESSFARVQTSVDNLTNALGAGVNLFEGITINNFEDARTKIFPRIVEYNVIQLLQVREEKDLPLVKATFAQLSEQGVAAVWEKILPDVTKHTNQICGLAFPREYIQEGKTLPLDMKYLSSLLPTTSASASAASSAARAAQPKKATSETTYMGLRRGFLLTSSAKRQEKLKPDAEPVSPFSMK